MAHFSHLTKDVKSCVKDASLRTIISRIQLSDVARCCVNDKGFSLQGHHCREREKDQPLHGCPVYS